MALDDAHYGFESLLDQYDYYYLSSYSKEKVESYEDTEELKKEDLQKEFDLVVKKLKSLLELECTQVGYQPMLLIHQWFVIHDMYLVTIRRHEMCCINKLIAW